MNPLRIFLALVAMWLLANPAFSQRFDCATPDEEEAASARMMTCDVDLSITPIKNVRVTFHVFQKDDGTGNVPNSSYGRYWLGLLNGGASDGMGNLQPMNLPTSSAYVQDTKIRYQLMNIYFWKNTTMWEKGSRNNASHSLAQYNYILTKNIAHKYTSIHVFIPGNWEADGLGSGGRACGIGCNKYSMLEDVYHDYVDGNNWWGPGGTLRHEYGHNLDLYHSWSWDACADTPTHGNCWNGPTCSNNVMDYNAHKCALTIDQVSRCHAWLSNSTAILASGITYGNLGITLSNSGNNGSVAGSTINVGSSSATINVSAPGTNSFTWQLQGGWGSYSFSTANSGKTVYVSGLGSIYLKVTWVENCQTYSRSLVFYNGGYYYSVGPNPTTGPLSISAKSGRQILTAIAEDEVIERPAVITRIEVYDIQSNLVQSIRANRADKIDIDLSAERVGAYQVVVYNEELTFTYKILKM